MTEKNALIQSIQPNTSFTLWIDADACPNILKELIFNSSDRHLLHTVFVANQPLAIKPSSRIKFIQVMQGADAADREIIKRMSAGDLVVTQDIPLAADVVAAGGYAINPRGEIYSEENIRIRLNMRDFMTNLRESGVHIGGSTPITAKDKKAFADSLEKMIVKRQKLQ